jgi:hypothetical protein
MQLPFPVSEDWAQARNQIEDLFRILYEERIGGLKTSTSLVKSNDVLRLFSGAANLHLLMDSSGDEAGWSNPYKIGTFTRAMDANAGDVSYTGIGFNPSCILFLAGLGTGGSIGICNASYSYCIYLFAGTYNYYSNCIDVLEDALKFQSAVLKTMDTDGFTLTWSKGSTPASANATVYYLAMR